MSIRRIGDMLYGAGFVLPAEKALKDSVISELEKHSVAEIAAGAGLSRMTLYKWLYGNGSIRYENLVKIIGFLAEGV